jgi:hypothetical protein
MPIYGSMSRQMQKQECGGKTREQEFVLKRNLGPFVEGADQEERTRARRWETNRGWAPLLESNAMEPRPRQDRGDLHG